MAIQTGGQTTIPLGFQRRCQGRCSVGRLSSALPDWAIRSRAATNLVVAGNPPGVNAKNRYFLRERTGCAGDQSRRHAYVLEVIAESHTTPNVFFEGCESATKIVGDVGS